MKKLFAFVLASIVFGSTLAFGQSRKPVIGLPEVSCKGYNASVGTQIRASFSDAIVNSRRFAVMERSAEELEKIRSENIETSGAINPNSILDYLLNCLVVNYESRSQTSTIPFLDIPVTNTTMSLTLSVTFTDVQSGQIVISESFTKSYKNKQDVTLATMSKEVADEMIVKIVEKLYPPTVLSVKGEYKTMMIPNSGFAVGDLVEIYSQGEPLLDVSGAVLGYDEELVGIAVVYEIGSGRMANIAKAAPDPQGKYKNADIQKGQLVRAKINSKGKKETNSYALSNLKKVGVMKTENVDSSSSNND